MSLDLHWRNSMRPPRFFGLDARAAVGLCLFLLHIQLWTLAFAIIVMVVFGILERFGLSFSSALRALRVNLLGRMRPSNQEQANRRWVEYTE